MNSSADNAKSSSGYDAIEREHHTISTEQVRTIFRKLDDLNERVETLERRLASSGAERD